MCRIDPDRYRDGCAFFATFFAQAKKVGYPHDFTLYDWQQYLDFADKRFGR
jgi:hypothetical protein